MVKQLQVWADSFKEGEWFLEILRRKFKSDLIEVNYRYNFQPVLTFSRGNNQPLFIASLYGDYKAWKPIPTTIATILEYGKPDIILYNPGQDKVFFAVEETAAVPTGNQSLQRLERVCYAAELGIPFVYLISEYGMHKDGGIRRSSIWPSYLAVKLSCQYCVPSLTLLYSDKEHPEDYDFGNGITYFSDLSYLVILEWLGIDVKETKKLLLMRIYREMGEFILDQVNEISPLLPGKEIITSEEFINFVVERIN